MYLSCCLGAYVSFGNETPQDLLKNYEPNAFITIGRIGMTCVCTAFYPLLVQPVRAVFMGWVESYINRAGAEARLSEAGLSLQPTIDTNAEVGVLSFRDHQSSRTRHR